MKHRILTPPRGTTLVEALITFLVLSLGLLAVSRVQGQLRLAGETARQRSEAVRLAEEDIEQLRGFSRIAAAGPAAGRAYADIVASARTVDSASGIIRMNQPTIRPQARRAPTLDAVTLARWLDAGRDDQGHEVLMLDTRNAFEVGHGRFAGALDWGLAAFGDFPAALQAHRAALAGKTVVSYCTGGIRCEKAALLMADSGVERVFQLEGGILNYFEATDGRHFEGHCFVFDDRQLLTDTLLPVDPHADTDTRGTRATQTLPNTARSVQK